MPRWTYVPDRAGYYWYCTPGRDDTIVRLSEGIAGLELEYFDDDGLYPLGAAEPGTWCFIGTEPPDADELFGAPDG